MRYPIGTFTVSGAITEDQVGAWLADLVALPGDLRRTVTPLSDPQLDTPYRPGGWTVRQVVHHLPDSHLNCFLRFRWALHRRPAGDQAVRRSAGGGATGLPDGPDRQFAGPSAGTARALGGTGAEPELGAAPADILEPGFGREHSGPHGRGLHLARAAPPRPRRKADRTRELGLTGWA
ncbi:Putative metal-dependent hydrolase BcerKBAB4_2443 [Geodia barretti]|uniref:Metal-dependent hydrolase BcerKBAB4_2443 n=1 Tax=Geodia barretti TaxID=519541 RepID=A0AA35S3E2_GEOBA|nr:Putative metal-dependent hydrolase BcerKBAB4_2443 [Geodia barretti]